MASKANSILTIMNLVNSIPLITGVVLAFIALRSGAKWLLGGDSSDIPEAAAARYSGGAQAKKIKAIVAK
jgi:cytochrome bd-type quinol oxidase subunit 2